ncbi:hypothetical protein PEX1_008180 [Penicillium expansum]|uniref:Ankyrin repeat-containing domain-containing protein n=1 Tax=Penicillium expansum TaxID=27334 RepID=A0A0A2K1Q4_PENEN|nr:hypothetical protein PEX2_076570 [Penicillium expansum]KGO39544.1 hypothetical protein PEXP_049590 [Penicillium expansum]KGO56829.1 hypothetical protein PEX2_076570 [Penicillium expansum]KGO61632.1 hypothetical protein PEX1_008180 [Penicillium expansum]
MKRPSNPVKFALSEGDIPLLQTLLSIDHIIDHSDSRAYMQYAIRLGNIEQLKILLTLMALSKGFCRTRSKSHFYRLQRKPGKTRWYLCF